MKRLMLAVVVSAAAVAPVFAADDLVAGHPDYFGRIEIGHAASPAVIYEQPVVVKSARRVAGAEPIYLRVQAKHARNWPKYCVRYDACGVPAYFVKDEWYRNVYVPTHREARQDLQKEKLR